MQTISGASWSSWAVEVAAAEAAAGSMPVHSPTKYVEAEDFVSITLFNELFSFSNNIIIFYYIYEIVISLKFQKSIL